MRIWRVAKRAFADLSGEGARLVGGRWNSPGRPMVYAAAEASLALLEVRAHLDLPFDLVPDDFVFMEIETGSAEVEDMALPPAAAECLHNGDRWLTEGRTPLLRVPSVVVSFSSNVLINPRHPGSRDVSIAALHPFQFDRRLWSSGTT